MISGFNKTNVYFQYLKLRTKQTVTSGNSAVSDEKQVKTEEKKQRDLYTVKLRELPYTTKKSDLKAFFHPLSTASIRIPRKLKGFAYVTFKTEKAMKSALLKNKSFLCKF